MTTPNPGAAASEREAREEIAESCRRLINDLAFAAPELWALHISRRMEEAVDAVLAVLDAERHSRRPRDVPFREIIVAAQDPETGEIEVGR